MILHYFFNKHIIYSLARNKESMAIMNLEFEKIQVPIIKSLKNCPTKQQQLDVIKTILPNIINREQVLGDLFKTFEKIFLVQPTGLIKKHLLSLKNSYDNNEELDENKLTAIALFIYNKSNLCKKEVINSKGFSRVKFDF